jgi:WD40 repeat protein
MTGLLLTAGNDKKIKVFNVKSMDLVQELTGHEGKVHAQPHM